MTSIRFVLTAGMALIFVGLGACGSTNIEVAPALSIVDTYPGNGASLQTDSPPNRSDYIEIVFSELVDGKTALEQIRLTSLTESDQVDTIFDLFADSSRGEAGVDAQTLSLTLLLNADPENSLFPANQRLRLVISKGLMAINGSVLPVDVVRRFSTHP